MARLDAVLRDRYHMLKSRRVAILRHVFGSHGVVLVAHLVSRMQEEPWCYLYANVELSIREVLKGSP